MKLHIYLGGGGLFKQPKCNNVRKGQAGVKRKVGFKKMFAERASWRRQASVSPSLSFILFVFIAFYFLFLATGENKDKKMSAGVRAGEDKRLFL